MAPGQEGSWLHVLTHVLGQKLICDEHRGMLEMHLQKKEGVSMFEMVCDALIIPNVSRASRSYLGPGAGAGFSSSKHGPNSVATF